MLGVIGSNVHDYWKDSMLHKQQIPYTVTSIMCIYTVYSCVYIHMLVTHCVNKLYYL